MIGPQQESIGDLSGKSSYLTAKEVNWEIFDLLSVKCRNCKYLPICSGGCPFSKMKTGKNICMWYKYGLKDYLKKLYELKYEGANSRD